MTKVKFSNKDIYNIRYFFSLFDKRKLKFPTSQFLFPTHTRKEKLSVDFKLYKNVIVNYFDSYFKNFYNEDTERYFPYSGKLIKAKGSAFYRNDKKGVFLENRSIVWIWFERPALSFLSNIKLIKMKGSSSKIDKLEKAYKEQNDIELLPNYGKVLNNYIANNKLYK